LGNIPGIYSENFYNYAPEGLINSNRINSGVLLNFDVIVFFNIGTYDEALCKILRDNNKVIIFDHCENIFGLGSEDAIMGYASAITCCSKALADLTDQYLSQRGIEKNIFVIRDPLDDSSPLPIAPLKKNTALIMGMGGNVRYVLPTLEPICEKAGYQILILSEAGLSCSSIHNYKIWSPYTWIEDACLCSVALCYHNEAQFPAKGNVKVTTPMSLGIPVLASPVASYKEAICDTNGFICENEGDWVKRLIELKNPIFRHFMGRRARQKALSEYSTDKIGLDYLSMIFYLMKNLT
jgi:hypothetical protein